MKPRVLMTNTAADWKPLTDELADRFALDINDTGRVLDDAEFKARLKESDAVISLLTEQFTAALLKDNPKLKLISNIAVGYDNIDVEAATACGIAVLNTPGVLDDTTADLAFGLLIATARRLIESDRFVRQGKWGDFEIDLMLGTEVTGKTLGIIGFGRIGQAVARRAAGFGMKVLFSRREGSPDPPSRITAPLKAERVTNDELVARSDFISLNCPLNDETRHLVNDDLLSKIKPGAILINTARGAVVDEAALVRALESGRLAGAGLDVFEHEPAVSEGLKKSDRVVLAPHIGSATRETRYAMAGLAVKGAIAALEGKKPDNLVNPEIWDTFLGRLATAV